jgi:hypothetical protein
VKRDAGENRKNSYGAFDRISSAWRRWTGGRWIILKMILVFVLLHYLWDYIGEDLFGLPGVVVDPLSFLFSGAIVY